LDSASLNYPGTDTLVPAIELAEICVIDSYSLVSRVHKQKKMKREFPKHIFHVFSKHYFSNIPLVDFFSLGNFPRFMLSTIVAN
jgi:hypothetical protein